MRKGKGIRQEIEIKVNVANSFRRKYVLSSLILFLVIISDQLTKAFFTSTCNSGIAFSFLQSKGHLNILLTFAVLVGVIFFLIKQETKLMIIAASLVLAGGLSNLIDRVVIGCVRDFIDFKYWPSFNLADSLISVGVIIAVENALRRKQSNDLNH